MKLKFKKILCLVLMAVTLLSCLPAQAAAVKVYVTVNKLPVYASASTSSKLLGTMTYGESMTYAYTTGGWGSTWATVRNSSGQVGYCKVSGIDEMNPNILNVKTATKVAAKVYDQPDDDSKVIHTCKKGSRVTVVAVTPDGDWYRVKDGSRYGYIEASDVNAIVWVSESSTCSLLSQYGGVKGVVSFGQAYEHISTEQKTHQKVCKIRNNKGQYAYVDYYAVTDENPLDVNETMYTQISGKILRKQIATKYGVSSIGKNKAVTVLGFTHNGQTAYVKYGSKFYYINAIYLHQDPAPSGGRMIYVTQDDVSLHKTASGASAVVTTVDEGDAVKLVGSSSNGLHPKVQTLSGKAGYNICGFFEASWQK